MFETTPHAGQWLLGLVCDCDASAAVVRGSLMSRCTGGRRAGIASLLAMVFVGACLAMVFLTDSPVCTLCVCWSFQWRHDVFFP